MAEESERRTKGEVEAQIASAIVRFHREQHGRGPTEVRAHVLGDLVVTRCSGILTQTETHLVGTEEGRRLIRSARQEMRSISQREVELAVATAAGCGVLRSYGDLDPRASELIEIYVLERDIECDLAVSGGGRTGVRGRTQKQ